MQDRRAVGDPVGEHLGLRAQQAGAMRKPQMERPATRLERPFPTRRGRPDATTRRRSEGTVPRRSPAGFPEAFTVLSLPQGFCLPPARPAIFRKWALAHFFCFQDT